MPQRIIQHLRDVPAWIARSPWPGRSVRTNAALSLLWAPALPHQLSVMVDIPTRRPVMLDAFCREQFSTGIDGHPTGLGHWSLIPHVPERTDGPDLADAVELVLAGNGVGRNVAIALPRLQVRCYLDRTFARVPHATQAGGSL